MGYLLDAFTKTSNIVLIKIMTKAAFVEIRIAFLITNCSICKKLGWAIIFALSLWDVRLTKTFWLTQESLCKQTQLWLYDA